MPASGSDERLAAKLAVLLPHLDERQRRLLLGAEARELGRGGIARVAAAAGVSRPTVSRGISEILTGADRGAGGGRVRRRGGGRKSLTETDPGLLAALDALVEPDTRGDPMSPLRWTTKSTRNLADALTAGGHPVSHVRVGELLHDLGYSLQGNLKSAEGTQHPDRDAQFRHINVVSKRYLKAGDPVISVDSKKKELVGQTPGYKNNGRDWQPKGQPVTVGVHDFPDPAMPKAVPYGIYDLSANTGWVTVGSDGDTAAFAVATLRRWWSQVGQAAYPDARRLLINADAGGSNGYRVRLWKTELARLASDTGLNITVCHYPPGTSKWNKIEHRLFSAITSNWRGQPLTSYQVVIELIGATTTGAGLTVHAEADTNSYPRGIKISDAQMAAIDPQLKPDKFHDEWNYTVKPATKTNRSTPRNS
jgi:Rhodopirellula transposase DDE domain